MKKLSFNLNKTIRNQSTTPCNNLKAAASVQLQVSRPLTASDVMTSWMGKKRAAAFLNMNRPWHSAIWGRLLSGDEKPREKGKHLSSHTLCAPVKGNITCSQVERLSCGNLLKPPPPFRYPLKLSARCWTDASEPSLGSELTVFQLARLACALTWLNRRAGAASLSWQLAHLVLQALKAVQPAKSEAKRRLPLFLGKLLLWRDRLVLGGVRIKQCVGVWVEKRGLRSWVRLSIRRLSSSRPALRCQRLPSEEALLAVGDLGLLSPRCRPGSNRCRRRGQPGRRSARRGVIQEWVTIAERLAVCLVRLTAYPGTRPQPWVAWEGSRGSGWSGRGGPCTTWLLSSWRSGRSMQTLGNETRMDIV